MRLRKSGFIFKALAVAGTFFYQQRINIIKIGHFSDVPTHIHQIGAPDLDKVLVPTFTFRAPKNLLKKA